ncbi:response regulator [Stappia sp. ICDLI1TA098]
MRKHRILLIEESAPARRLIREMLERIGFEHVEEAAGVKAGERLLEAQGFDLVLLEWRQPRLEGMRFLKRLRADERLRLAVTPVIVSCADVDLELLKLAADLDAHSVLAKPFSLKSLKSHVEAVLGAAPARAKLRVPKGTAKPVEEEPPRAAEPDATAEDDIFYL